VERFEPGELKVSAEPRLRIVEGSRASRAPKPPSTSKESAVGCLCGEPAARPLFSNDSRYGQLARLLPGATVYPGEFGAVECRACGLARIDPPPYSAVTAMDHYQQDLTEFYRDKRAEHFSYARFLFEYVRRYKTAGSVVDVGCGPGFTIAYAREIGFAAIGLEINKHVVAFARRFLGDGIHESTVQDFARDHVDSADVVILNHVIEHVVDLEGLLGSVRDMLRPGGIMLVAVPNFASLPSRLMRNRWYGLEPANHVWQFTRRTLSSAIERGGFEVLETDVRTVMDTDYHVFRPPGVLNALLFRTIYPLLEKLKVCDQILCIARPRR
jgi:2-polyprenyl-3-methyl-5-hydroxy-6-metoxy-1,4-benzoquinol methylase